VKAKCQKCGGTNVLGQYWAPINKVEPMPEGTEIPGITVPMVAPIEAEPAWDVVGYEGAWCPDCDNHVEVEFDDSP
jgi:hypothetical protein